MRLDPNAVVHKAVVLQRSLRKALKNKRNFKKAHETVRNLCETTLKRSEYKAIDIEYPDPVIFVLMSPYDGSKKVLNPKSQNQRWQLANKEIAVLDKIKAKYVLLAQLQAK